MAVYYGGTFRGQTMLYREFHRTTSAPALGALQQMLGAPVDPDYHALWPVGTHVVSLTRSGDTATVTLSAAPFPSTSKLANLPVQEVVYTLTAADPTIHKVTLVYPGGQVVGAVRGTTYEVLAQVWALAPLSGASTTSPVTISGVAEVFEARVSSGGRPSRRHGRRVGRHQRDPGGARPVALVGVRAAAQGQLPAQGLRDLGQGRNRRLAGHQAVHGALGPRVRPR